MRPYDSASFEAVIPSIAATDDTAMAELRRVCSGDRNPPPPAYCPLVDPFRVRASNSNGHPDNDTGIPLRPRPLVESDWDCVGRGGLTGNRNATDAASANWGYIVIVVLLATAAGLIMRFRGYP